jgi:hypothetical protein
MVEHHLRALTVDLVCEVLRVRPVGEHRERDAVRRAEKPVHGLGRVADVVDHDRDPRAVARRGRQAHRVELDRDDLLAVEAERDALVVRARLAANGRALELEARFLEILEEHGHAARHDVDRHLGVRERARRVRGRDDALVAHIAAADAALRERVSDRSGELVGAARRPRNRGDRRGIARPRRTIAGDGANAARSAQRNAAANSAKKNPAETRRPKGKVQSSELRVQSNDPEAA